MSSTKRAAIYVRVSTADQDTDMQLREAMAFVEARGWQIAGVYEDKASGTNTSRPQLRALFTDARLRKFDIIVCWKLDRLARSLRDLVTMLQELNELGVEFVSIRDALDMTTSAGRLMVHLVAAFAEFESSVIKERVRAGIANAKAKGTRFGRKPFISETKVVELRSQGWSFGKIARYLGVSKAGVHKVLSQSTVTIASTISETTKDANRSLT